jgi:hypothetical protein
MAAALSNLKHIAWFRIRSIFRSPGLADDGIHLLELPQRLMMTNDDYYY